MKTILIKSAKFRGQDSRTFRAYHAASLKPLGVSASSTSGAVHAAGACAVKAFIKLVEPTAEADEIRTRISLREVLANPLTYAAELQPKNVCYKPGTCHCPACYLERQQQD